MESKFEYSKNFMKHMNLFLISFIKKKESNASQLGSSLNISITPLNALIVNHESLILVGKRKFI